METPILTAVVPVRAGSRRLKNKNLSPFAGTTLLQHKIEQLKAVKTINAIVVSSDSEEMLALAKNLGVETHERNAEYCDEQSKSFGEVVEHVASSVQGDHILWAPCTAPLITPHLYDIAIEKYLKLQLDQTFDSLISVQRFQRYLWNEEAPVNYKLGTDHVPSQQLPVWHIVSDGIIIAPRKSMICWKYFHGANPYRFEIDKRSACDIDDVLDLLAARAWLNEHEQIDNS